MVRKAALLVFFQTFTSTYMRLKELSVHEKIVRESLTQCVISAAERFFDEEQIIFYSLPLEEVSATVPSVALLDRIIFARLTEKCKWSMIVRNVSLEEREFYPNVYKPQHYIIHMRNHNEFVENLNILRNYKNWNPHAKFLIISAAVVTQPRKLATRVMKKLWEVHVINGIILLTNQLNNTIFNVYAWYPYKDGNCGTNFNKVTHIDTCGFGKHSELTDWYPNKIPQKFNQCVINVRLINWPPYVINITNGTWSSTASSTSRGVEVNLLDIIADFFNLRMFYYYSPEALNWGEVFPNGTITGNLKYLYDERDDISLGAYAKTMQKSSVFEDTFYHYESLVFCVPYRIRNTKLQSILNIMGTGALLISVLVYCTTTALMWLTSGKDLNPYKNFDVILMNNFSALLGLSVFVKPKTSKVRFFMALLLAYSFCILTAYQTFLTSALASVSEKQEINTVTDLLNSDINVYGIKTTTRYFGTDGSHSQTNEINAGILKKWKNCNDTRKCLEYVAFRRDAAVCFPRLFIEYIVNSYKTSRNDPLIYCFDKAVVSYPLTILMRKGFQLYGKLNFLVIRILSAGLIQKWERDILRTRYENFTTSAVEIDKSSDELDFNSLKPVFWVWCVGILIAAFVFFCEMILYKWVNKTKETASVGNKK